MLLAYHRECIKKLRLPTADEPWRVLTSGCLAGWQCGIDGSDYGLGKKLIDLFTLPAIRTFPFCPEKYAIGVPRTTPDIHGGDGFDVISGHAEVLDENGSNLTEKMLRGAEAMLAFAKEKDIEFAILTDMSASCGSQIISDGSRLSKKRQYQKGVGISTALLLNEGIPVVSQRDFLTLSILRSRLDPNFVPSPELRDHHEHSWVAEHLPKPHPRS